MAPTLEILIYCSKIEPGHQNLKTKNETLSSDSTAHPGLKSNPFLPQRLRGMEVT